MSAGLVVVVMLAIADAEGNERQAAKFACGAADALAGEFGNAVGVDGIGLGRRVQRRGSEAMAGENPVGAGEHQTTHAGAAGCLDHVLGEVDVVTLRGIPGGAGAGIARKMQDRIDAGETVRPVIAEQREVGRFDGGIATRVAVEQDEHPSEGCMWMRSREPRAPAAPVIRTCGMATSQGWAVGTAAGHGKRAAAFSSISTIR